MFKEDFTNEWEQMRAAFKILEAGRGHIEIVRINGRCKKVTVDGPRKRQQRGPAISNQFYFLKR